MRIRMAFVLAIISVYGALPAPAQVIGGRVIDGRSRLPTRLLSVLVLGDGDRVVARTRTDTSGVFQLLLPAGGRFRLRFVLDSTMTSDSDTIAVDDDGFVERQFVVHLPRVFFEFEVERPVQQMGGTGSPRYPLSLKQRNIEGEVLVQFVVDADGLPRLETFRVLRSTDAGFSDAVRAWLPTARYSPAELGGRRVPQLVHQPFTFALVRDR